MENKNFENYYYISHCVNCEPIILKRLNCDDLDKTRIKEGNAYKTKKQAEKALKEYKEKWLKSHKTLIKGDSLGFNPSKFSRESE